MPNWLTKATGGSSRKSLDAPQDFKVVCECAESHAGQRKVRPQRIICRTCGSALFVLPKNVYPALREQASAKNRSRKKRRSPVPAATMLPSANDLAASVRRGVTGTASSIGRGIVGAASRAMKRLLESIKSSARQIRLAFTPFRVVVLGMAMILIATSAVALRARIVESARERLRQGFEDGQEALAKNDIVGARDHFAHAAAAVETLGIDDTQSRLVQQLYRETSAMTRLAPGSIFQILQDAEDSLGRASAFRWEDVFRARYHGKWLIFHAPVMRTSTGFVVDLPVSVGREDRKLVVRADLKEFDRLSFEGDATVAVFAAPLMNCELNDSQDEWTITLDAEEGFLWTTLDNLRPFGFLDSSWQDENELASLLDSQKRALEQLP